MIARAKLSGTRNAKNATTMHVIISVASFLLLRFISFAVCAKRFIVVVSIPSVVVVVIRMVVVFCRLSFDERESAILKRLKEKDFSRKRRRTLYVVSLAS